MFNIRGVCNYIIYIIYIARPYDISHPKPWFYVEGHFSLGVLEFVQWIPRNTFCPKKFRRFRWVDRLGRWKALERSYGHRQVAGGWSMQLWWLNSPFPLVFFGGSRLLIYMYIYIHSVCIRLWINCNNVTSKCIDVHCILCMYIYIYIHIYTLLHINLLYFIL